MLLNIPVWTIPPDWGSAPVTESLEWLTNVMTSRIGAEQRQQLRLGPRRNIEFTVQPTKRWRTYYDALMSTPFQDEFYLPLWYESARSVDAVLPTDLTLVLEGERAELASARVLFMKGRYPYLYELVEVDPLATVVGSGITTFTLTDGFVGPWPARTRVYNAVSAIIDEQPSYDRQGDRALQSSIRFRLNEITDWAGTVSPDIYLGGFPIIDFRTNEADTQTGGYDRQVATLDNNTGIPLRLDLAGIPFQKNTPSGWFRGRTDADNLRSLLYALKGRRGQGWFVSPTEDFRLVVPATAGDTVLTVERNGFSDLGGPVEGRQDIFIRSRTLGTIPARVLTSSIIDDETESITIDAPLADDLVLSDIKRISFMRLGRLDQDKIDLVHQTDSDGVVSFAVACRAVPDLRVATAWTPPPFPWPDPDGACGPDLIWLRISSDPSIWNGNPDASPLLGTGGFSIQTWLQLTGAAVIAPAFGVNTDGTGVGQMSVNLNGPFVMGAPATSSAYGGHLDAAAKGPDLILTGDVITAPPNTGAQLVTADTTNDQKPGLRYFEVTFDAQSRSASFGLMDWAKPRTVSGDPDDFQYLISLAQPGYFLFTFGPATITVPIADGTTFGVAMFTRAPP